MSKRDKLLQKLRNHPKGVQFKDLETLLLRFGFVLVRIQGSHHVFQYKKGDIESVIVVPVHGNQVKAPYVKEAVQLLHTLFSESATDEEEGDDDDSEST